MCGNKCYTCFVTNFILLPAIKKIENRLRFDEVRANYKVESFVLHSVGM